MIGCFGILHLPRDLRRRIGKEFDGFGLVTIRHSLFGEKLPKKSCEEAAKRGWLWWLQWARANGCEWDRRTCTYAALTGHLEVLKWARANGCEWDWKRALTQRGTDQRKP